MKRCFIAIKIPLLNSLLNFYQQARKEFSDSDVNWVKPENMHLTLAFLGQLQQKQVEETKQILNNICLKIEPFDLELKGFGSFGRGANPCVLWIGVNTSYKLNELKIQLNTELALTGYKPDKNIFQPHLTVGRIKMIKNQSELFNLGEKYKEHSFIIFRVNSIILYESILSSLSPKYTPISDFPLRR